MEDQALNCPVCEKRVELGARFCESCGVLLRGEGPDNADYLLVQVARLIDMNEREKVMGTAKELVEKGVGSCSFYQAIADYCLKCEDGQGAIFWLDRALEKESNSVDMLEIHQKKGNIFSSWGYLDQAEYEMRQALQELSVGRKNPPPPAIAISAWNLAMSLVDGPGIDTEGYWKEYFKNKQEAITRTLTPIVTARVEINKKRIMDLIGEGRLEEALKDMTSLRGYVKQNSGYIYNSDKKAKREYEKWEKQTQDNLRKCFE